MGGTACLVGPPHRDTLVATTPLTLAVFPRAAFNALADEEMVYFGEGTSRPEVPDAPAAVVSSARDGKLA